MQTTEQQQQRCIVIVDPYSTGSSVSLELHKRGFPLIALWTDDVGESKEHWCEEALRMSRDKLYMAEVSQAGETSMEELAARLRAAAGSLAICDLVCGGETGVKLADVLSEAMGLRTNGTDGGAMKDRRDKSIQQDSVRATGLRACREACGTRWEDVAAFTETEALPIVVKPVESAGSDGVKLCHSIKEVKEHFELLMSSQRKAGAASGAAVLLQEFLKGKEYVVDHVTRDGEHKTTMVWVYDKRAANGSAFVYYDMLPVPCASELARSLIAYTRGVLDAVKIHNGATHTEIMMTADGPCLVEVNCRCHGGNGAWLPLASRLTGGVTQVNALADAFTDADAFARIPDVPGPFLAGGCNPMFVSHKEGKIIGRSGYERIRAMRSFVSLDENYQEGDTLERTIDLFTAAGQCILVHDDRAVVAADVAAIRAMEADGSMFEIEGVEVHAPVPKTAIAARTSAAFLSELSDSSTNAAGWPAVRSSAASAA